jgi:anti-anti-sigma factor
MTHATVTADLDGDHLGVALAGEIDLSNADDVQSQILELTSNQLMHVLVDLSELDYLDSAGLRMLFTLAARLDVSQIGLELLVPEGSPVREMIELVGLSSVATVHSPPG